MTWSGDVDCGGNLADVRGCGAESAIVIPGIGSVKW